LHDKTRLLAAAQVPKVAIVLIVSALLDVFPFVSHLCYFFMLPVLEFSSVIKMRVPLASTVVPILQGLAPYLEEFCCVCDINHKIKQQIDSVVLIQLAICVEWYCPTLKIYSF
jgi:hypothetical protein